jgi:RimJ/RimL family protein N-acetyltransferase
VTDLKGYQAADRLKDGTPVVVRAIRHDDGPDVLAAFKRLDPEAIYTRFFAYKKELSAPELAQITDVDFERVVALVVRLPAGGDGKLIGGGRYFADTSGATAELAFVTGDAYAGLGIASLLLRHLVTLARERGVRRFEAEVLAHNRPMLAVFRKSGLPIKERADGNTVHVTLRLDTEG